MLNLKITLKRCKSQLPTFKTILPQFSGYIIKLLAYIDAKLYLIQTQMKGLNES